MTSQNESQVFCEWIQSRVDDGTLKPGRAMVLGGDMVEETAMLLRNGYEVILVDPGGNDLKAAKQRKLNLKWGTTLNFTEVKPWHAGHLDLILDRGTLARLRPDDRFSYVNRMGRFLPSGGNLAGMFRLGMGQETEPPYSLTPDYFRRLMARYFLLENIQAIPDSTVSSVNLSLGLLERRSLPRRAPRHR